jgi:hypothetical protein
MYSLYYQNAISRLSSGFGGLGRHEAKMWHGRAYAGWVSAGVIIDLLAAMVAYHWLIG